MRLPHPRDLSKSDAEMVNEMRAAGGVAAVLLRIEAVLADIRRSGEKG